MATPTQRLEPRKAPKQPRSQETLERVLDAAARVFAEHGYAAGTTNRIAAAASMSIGSLYQYFPNKDAILVALCRRHVRASTALIEAVVAQPELLPVDLDERLRLFVDVTVDAHEGGRRLHQVLFEEAPRPRDLVDELHQAEDRIVAVVVQLLADDPTVGLPPGDLPMAARLVVWSIESLVHRFIASDGLDEAAFRRQLTELLGTYLRSGGLG